MSQSPDEKTYVEIPFIDQLKGMGWDHIEGDTHVDNLPSIIQPEDLRGIHL